MPETRQYPQAFSLLATDAFLIDRLSVGTMYIENPFNTLITVTDGVHTVTQVSEVDFISGATVGGTSPTATVAVTPGGGITPYAGQMCINNGFDWAHQTGIDHSIFWVPWDHLTTNSTGTPAYNPDGICTLTAPVGNIASDSFLAPPGAGTAGHTFPGIVIPVDGYYYLYSEINVFYTIAGPVTEQICCAIFTWKADGSGRQFIDSDTQLTLTNTEPPQESQALRVAGGAFLTAGSVVCVRLANTSGVDLNGTLLLDEFSWFGAFRIR